MNTSLTQIENKLWSAADELRANSSLKGSEYSTPVLGLIFLKYADYKFKQVQQELNSETPSGARIRIDERTQFQAQGAFYLPDVARFDYLLNLPESDNIGQAITNAMKAIEAENKQVEGVLPKNYNRLEKSTLIELLRIMGQIPMDIEGDAFGKVYEYFLGNFAMSEGQKGGEFFTPTSLVKLHLLKYSNLFTDVSLIQHAAQAVCSSKAKSLFGITHKTVIRDILAFMVLNG